MTLLVFHRAYVIECSQLPYKIDTIQLKKKNAGTEASGGNRNLPKVNVVAAKVIPALHPSRHSHPVPHHLRPLCPPSLTLGLAMKLALAEGMMANVMEAKA